MNLKTIQCESTFYNRKRLTRHSCNVNHKTRKPPLPSRREKNFINSTDPKRRMEMHLHFDRDTPTIASSSMKIMRSRHCQNKLTTSSLLINLSAEMTWHMIEVLTLPSTNHTHFQTLPNQHPQHKPLRKSPTHRETKIWKNRAIQK